MDFTHSETQRSVAEAIGRIAARFDDAYWLARDTDGRFPAELHEALARDGWLGIAMPEAFGGAGLGITEAAIMMHGIAASGAGLTGASAVHMNIFGLNPVVVFGTEEQKARMLPPLIAGRERACFAVTEPDAGLETTAIRTRAERHGDRYLVHGQKVWTSTAQIADRMLLLARTTPVEQCRKRTDGLTLFYTALDRNRVEARIIEKMGRKAVDSNQLFIDGLEIPVEDRIGEEGQGFPIILHGLNPERILIAAEAVGLGQAALRKATRYASERTVFGRKIGKNQAIQHPLARSWAELEAAWLMTLRAATAYDRGEPAGAHANAAKLLAAEAGFRACEAAVLTHGGYGYAREYHVERYFREIMIPRLVPVSAELILCYLAEHVLGLPKSYGTD